MNRKLIIGELDGAPSVCVLEDGEAVEILTGSQLFGNVYLGRVISLQPGLDAAFIDIGLGKNAILSGKDVAVEKPKVGDELIVQIAKNPGGDKGAVVRRDIRLAGRFCVLMPMNGTVGVSRRVEDESESERLRRLAQKVRIPGMGIILRTNAADAAEEEIVSDIAALRGAWTAMEQKAQHIKAPALLRDEGSILYRAARDIFCKDLKEVEISSKKLYNIFSGYVDTFSPALRDRVKLNETGDLFTVYRLRAQLEDARKRKINLPCGGSIVIDRTEAMTVIDVNSGKYTGSHDARKTILRVNLEAAKEIAKQLRLRDIGGIIIVDFIDMAEKEDRTTLLDAMRQHLLSDRSRARAIDITALGLMEITRMKKDESGT